MITPPRVDGPALLHDTRLAVAHAGDEYSLSADELKQSITTIVECGTGNRLKGYLAV